MSWLALLLHLGLIAVAGPVLRGVSGRWRSGAAVAQPWRDLVRLWRKSGVAPAGASFVFGAAPAVSLGAAAVAAVLVPSFTLGMPTGGMADIVVVVGLLALSQAVLALAGHDVGAGLAGRRAMAGGVGAVPVLMLVALAAMLLAGSANIDAAAAAVRDGGAGARMSGGLAGAAAFGVMLGERAAPMGAYAGRLRALAVVAEGLQRVVMLSVVADLALPFGMAAAGSGVGAWGIGIVCWVLKVGALGAVAAAIGPGRLPLRAAALAAGLAVVLASVQGAA